MASAPLSATVDVGVAPLEQRRHREDVAEVVVDHEELHAVEGAIVARLAVRSAHVDRVWIRVRGGLPGRPAAVARRGLGASGR